MQTPVPVPVPEPDVRDCSLREWGADDAPTALEAVVDPLASRYRYSLPCSLDAAQGWVAHAHKDRLDGVPLELAIVEHQRCRVCIADRSRPRQLDGPLLAALGRPPPRVGLTRSLATVLLGVHS